MRCSSRFGQSFYISRCGIKDLETYFEIFAPEPTIAPFRLIIHHFLIRTIVPLLTFSHSFTLILTSEFGEPPPVYTYANSVTFGSIKKTA